MMASRKFKEEHEERQRRAAASANTAPFPIRSANTNPTVAIHDNAGFNNNHKHHNNNTPHAQQNQHHSPVTSIHSYNGTTPVKVERKSYE